MPWRSGGVQWDSMDEATMLPSGQENVELLVETMVYIDENPRQHDQSLWYATTDCGSYACYAGHALILAGWQPYMPDYQGLPTRSSDRFLPPEFEGDAAANAVYVEDAARKILGITAEQATILFHGELDGDTMRRYITELTRDAYPPEVAS